MTTTQLDLLKAIERRERGMATVIEYADPDYADQLMQAIEVLAARGVPFMADDAREIVGNPPASCHPNIAGAIFNAAAKRGLIRQVGFGRSARVVGHANRVVLWQGAR